MDRLIYMPEDNWAYRFFSKLNSQWPAKVWNILLDIDKLRQETLDQLEQSGKLNYTDWEKADSKRKQFTKDLNHIEHNIKQEKHQSLVDDSTESIGLAIIYWCKARLLYTDILLTLLYYKSHHNLLQKQWSLIYRKFTTAQYYIKKAIEYLGGNDDNPDPEQRGGLCHLMKLMNDDYLAFEYLANEMDCSFSDSFIAKLLNLLKKSFIVSIVERQIRDTTLPPIETGIIARQACRNIVILDGSTTTRVASACLQKAQEDRIKQLKEILESILKIIEFKERKISTDRISEKFFIRESFLARDMNLPVVTGMIAQQACGNIIVRYGSTTEYLVSVCAQKAQEDRIKQLKEILESILKIIEFKERKISANGISGKFFIRKRFLELSLPEASYNDSKARKLH